MIIKENGLGLRQYIMTNKVIKGTTSTSYSQIVQKITCIERDRDKENDRANWTKP